MCDMCGPYYDNRPTLNELEAEEQQERMENTLCDMCGERMRYCNCEPEEE